MRRDRLMAMVLSSVLVLGTAVPASAAVAADFAGVWTSVDVVDGSDQIMVIRNNLAVTLFDSNATVACDPAGPAVVWGKGKIVGAEENRLRVKNATVQCADGQPSFTAKVVFRLRPNGTLREIGTGTIWTRIGP